MAATTGPQADIPALDPATPIERELKGGQSHAYRVRLNAGQFLHLTVEQIGIDVEVSLLDPAGQPLATQDGPNGSYGPEPIVVIAATAGDYRLAVRAPDESSPRGRYRVTINAAREATAADREHVAAESAFAEVMLKLLPQQTAAARHTAIEKCQQALTFFQSAGDVYRQAIILHVIGRLYAESGEFRRAMESFNEALPLFRSVGDRRQEGVMLNFLGGMSDQVGDLRKALDYYGQALPLAREGEDRFVEATILNNVGKINSDQADWQKAIEYLQQALLLHRAGGDQREEAIALHNIGAAYSHLGEFARALDYLRQSLSLRRAVGDKVGEADALDFIGKVHLLLNRPQEAIGYYNQALPLRLAVGNRRGESTTLDQLGVAYASTGELTKALGYHQQALERLHGSDSRVAALALGNIAYVYNSMRQPQKALDFYNQALTLFRKVGDRQAEAEMLQGIARAERDRGNLAEARHQIEAALPLIEAVRANVGSQQLRASYLATNQDAYQFYIDLLMRLHRREPSRGYDALALQVSERARARSLLEQLKEAQVNFREGVDRALIEREGDLRQQLNARSERLLRLLGQPDAQAQADRFKSEIGQLESEYEQVQVAIRKRSPRYAAITQPQPLGLKAIQQLLDDETLLLEYALGDERSVVWAVTATSLTTHDLPRREAINDQARRVYDLLIARNAIRRGATALERRQRIAQADARLAAAAWQLSRTVLGPVASELSNKRLVIVADGALQYIPFAMLPAPRANDTPATGDRTPLVVEHEIISLPSASTLAIQRQELAGRKAAPYGIAVIADPVFSASDERLAHHPPAVANAPAAGGTRILEHLAAKQGSAPGGLRIPRLPFTRQEAERIIAAAPAMNNYKAMDFNASRATVAGEALGRYRFIHFATHGYLDTEQPESSALVLSLVNERGEPQDGFLRLREVYNLKLPAELVVLSACQTGLGKEIRGEGLEGLTRGFMYAGAARVVVSLWSVNDRATSELMAKLYEKMLKEGERPAAALRAAQVEMSKQKPWRSPFYWAAFVIQGEWR